MTFNPAHPVSGEVRAVQPETVVARLRSHSRTLFLPALILIADAGAVGYFGGSFPEDWQNLAILACALLVMVLFFLFPLIAWLGKNYTITTRRIVLRRGLFVRHRQELLHSRGYDITVRQNILQRIFSSGDLLVNTGLEHPVLLRDVPSVVLVQATLGDLMALSVNPVAAERQREHARLPDETTFLNMHR